MAVTATNKWTYDYWRAALKGNLGAVHDGDAQPGFWRKRTSRAGPFIPCAIWDQGGELVALLNGAPADPAELWSHVCRFPIEEEWYHARMAGKPWPDEDATVTKTLEKAAPKAEPRATIGDNNPPTDEAEVLKGQIEAAVAGAEGYDEISDDAMAKKAQSLRARLNELSGTADKNRESEKKPHLEAGKKIDAKWQPLVKLAKGAADAIAKALGAHETRKADAVAKAKREAEERAAQAQAGGEPVPEPEVAVPAPEPQAAIRGAYGRAATVKAVKVATVVDQDKAYSFLRTHKDMVDLIARLAQRAVDAGLDVPGVTVKEERKVT